MITRTVTVTRFLILCLCSASLSLPATAQQRTPDSEQRASTFTEKVVAGSKEDFMLVRHVRIDGSNVEIGRRLADLASRYHKWSPQLASEDDRYPEQMEFFRERWPSQFDRIRGIASHLGVDDSVAGQQVLSELTYLDPGGACTCFYASPEQSGVPGGLFSRNFDFTTGTFPGPNAIEGSTPVCSRPYVIELHPERGYSTLAICCFDLLGVVDGINSEGLTVALLADDEAIGLGLSDPSRGCQPGLRVLELPRYLLETCADVPQAKAALAEIDYYYQSIPCHYLIADRQGRSFVWERNLHGDGGWVFEGDGAIQTSTNFMYQLHPNLTELPAEAHRLGSFNRFRAVQRMGEERMSVERAKETSALVAATGGTGTPPSRTLWHSLYRLQERQLHVSFYLGESDEGQQVRRSDYLEFALDGSLQTSLPDLTPASADR